MKKGLHRLMKTIHKTANRRSRKRIVERDWDVSQPIPNWWQCKTIQPLEVAR